MSRPDVVPPAVSTTGLQGLLQFAAKGSDGQQPFDLDPHLEAPENIRPEWVEYINSVGWPSAVSRSRIVTISLEQVGRAMGKTPHDNTVRLTVLPGVEARFEHSYARLAEGGSGQRFLWFGTLTREFDEFDMRATRVGARTRIRFEIDGMEYLIRSLEENVYAIMELMESTAAYLPCGTD